MTKLDKIAYSLFGIAIGIAAVLRIILPWQTVFKAGRVVFTEVDPYYHMRLADTIIHNWQNNTVDPYFGFTLTTKQTFAWIISLLSFGKVEWLDTIAAFIPAVCGILLVIVVFFLAKKLFNLWTSVLSALIVAVLPGDMLARTSLGFVDQHCMEILLTVSIICCIVYALKKNIHFMWAAGALFGLYFLIWEGAPLLLVILDIYILVQSIVNSVQRNNDPKVYWIMAVVNFTAMFMFMLVPAQRSMMQDTFVLSLALSAVLPIVLYWIFKETAYLGTAAYLAVLAIVGVVMAIVVFTVAVFAPGSFDIVTTGFLRITALNGNGSILESQPMSFQIMWSNLGVVAIFGLMGIVLLSMYEKWKDGSVGLIVVWSIMILVVSMLQRRFVYYLAPIMGVSCAYVIVFLGSKLIRKYKAEARTLAVSCVIVFCLAFILVPNTLAAGRQAERAEFEPTSAWLSACDWLKDNTPEPFESGYYYQIYKSANIDNGYRVLSWWDSGYWIVRIAQRPVLCTPGGGLLNETAEILANDNITEATMRARELRVEYIIIDYNMIGIKWPSIQNGKGKEIENSFMNKLWTEEKVEGWVKCWQSKEKYAKDSQVKIYKYKEE